jgi:probable F420-dependent oxidoreductase
MALHCTTVEWIGSAKNAIVARIFRFGAQLSGPLGVDAWWDTVRAVESLGYSSLLMPDHFSEQWGPWVALTVAAMAAPTLRIGTLVLDNDFRHPAEVAKEAATLDVVSGGRLELGVGAGWAVSDYQRSGIPYESPATRIARFEEALTILRGSFSDDSFSFTGRHYQVTALNGQPKPVQSRIRV